MQLRVLSNQIFHILLRSKLLLEVQVLLRDPLLVLKRQFLGCILEKDVGAIVRFLLDFEFGKLYHEILVYGLSSQFCQSSFIYCPRKFSLAVSLLKLGELEVASHCGIHIDESLENAAAPLNILVI